VQIAAAVRERGCRSRPEVAAGAAAGWAEPVGDGQRMAELRVRRDACRATVMFRPGSVAGAGVRWRRTTVPTLESDAAFRAFAGRTGVPIDAWLVRGPGARAPGLTRGCRRRARVPTSAGRGRCAGARLTQPTGGCCWSGCWLGGARRRGPGRATVMFRPGSVAVAGVRLRRTTVPTLESDAAFRRSRGERGSRSMRGWLTTRARRSWSGARVGGYRLCGRWQRLQAASLLQARYLHGGVAGGLHAARDTQGARAPHSEVVRYPLLDRVHLGGVERGAEGSVTGEHGCGPSSGTPSNRSAHALSAHRSGPARRTGASPLAAAHCGRGLRHGGLWSGARRVQHCSLFSSISAPQPGGLSTAIEAGVPEAIFWMQSGHAQDAAARRFVHLRSPKLLYRSWEAFTL
jgi:hypothetical protein